MFDLTGKVALLTGASKGMGLRWPRARRARRDSGDFIPHARRSGLRRQARSTTAVGATRPRRRGQHRHKESLASACGQDPRDRRPIDIVVGNAGVNPYFGPIAGISDKDYERTMNANVQSNLWLAKMVAPDMAAKGQRIDDVHLVHRRVQSVRHAWSLRHVKAGADRPCAQSGDGVWPQGIRFNAICPGLIKTDFARELWDKPGVEEKYSKGIPLRRLGEPDDFAGLAVFLGSDASKYMTGQALTVCGGSSMWA